MPRHSRIRRILKWTGTGLSLLILVLWILGLWFEAAVVLPGNFVAAFDIMGMHASTSNQDVRTFTSTCIRRHGLLGVDYDSYWFFHESRWARTTVSIFTLPFWLALLLTAIPTAWLWHRDRRLISSSPDHRLCSGCGYDLTGNTSGVCSECGLGKPQPTDAKAV